MLKLVLAVSVSIATLAGAAAAQNRDAAPTFGVVDLTADFDPDPVLVAMYTGDGDVEAPCGGSVRAAPDVEVSYAGGSAPLIVSVASPTDTSLLVVSPDGTWHCDNDSGAGPGNPAILFENAQSGTYHIWVGGAASAPAALTLSQTIRR